MVSRSPPLRVFYFRHGETEWSLSGQHTGKADIPLTLHGEEQARALRPWVEAIAFAHVLASPRQRARRTGELAGLDGRLQIEPDLAEWDYGDYEGLRSGEIERERPGWNLFRDGCPNGETPGAVAARADRLIARLRTLEGDVALFSHGHFGAVLGVRWIGSPILAGQHFTLAPASMSAWGYQANHPDVPVILLWNAAASGGLPPSGRSAGAARP